MADQKKCRHEKRRVSGVAGGRAKVVMCETCGEQWEIPFTAEEKRLWREKMKKDYQRTKDIHGLGWAFQKAFHRYKKVRVSSDYHAQMVKMSKLVNKGKKVSRYQFVRDGWKYNGYEMMRQVEKFANKHPEVVICSCDDSYHASSMVVFIPHRAKEEFWGTTVVSIPQCSGEPPLEMFFYPGHALGIEKALHVFNQESRQKNKKKQHQGYWPKP
jgi:ribosomal protein L31